MDELLVDQQFQLQKMPGKGGWTYVVIPDVPNERKEAFGMVKVRGSIDSYELEDYRLMPMAIGALFLPVKTEIRKKIGKKQGDWVQVVLYFDRRPLHIPEELIMCLQVEPVAYERFMKLGEGGKKEYRDWVYSAKREQTRADRIIKMIDMLLTGKKLNRPAGK